MITVLRSGRRERPVAHIQQKLTQVIPPPLPPPPPHSPHLYLPLAKVTEAREGIDGICHIFVKGL